MKRIRAIAFLVLAGALLAWGALVLAGAVLESEQRGQRSAEEWGQFHSQGWQVRAEVLPYWKAALEIEAEWRGIDVLAVAPPTDTGRAIIVIADSDHARVTRYSAAEVVRLYTEIYRKLDDLAGGAALVAIYAAGQPEQGAYFLEFVSFCAGGQEELDLTACFHNALYVDFTAYAALEGR